MSKKPKRVFLSLPMSGRSDEEIKLQLAIMRNLVRNSKEFAWGAESVDNFDTPIPQEFIDIVDEPALLYLGKAIQLMSNCDAILMGEGWADARGCRVENKVAVEYGIKIFYQSDVRWLRNESEG